MRDVSRESANTLADGYARLDQSDQLLSFFARHPLLTRRQLALLLHRAS